MFLSLQNWLNNRRYAIRKYVYYSCTCLILCVFSFHTLCAQQSRRVTVFEEWKQPVSCKMKGDSLVLVSYFENRVRNWRKQGYWSASIDSLRILDSLVELYLYKGSKTPYIYMNIASLNGKTLKSDVRSSEKDSLLIVKPYKVYERQQQVVKNLTNNGFPFASCEVKIIGEKGGLPVLKLDVPITDRFEWDSLEMGKTRVRRTFLETYLSIRPGKVYKEDDAKEISRKLNSLNFIEVQEPAEILFDRSKAKPILKFKDRRNNKIDLLIGFLPNTAGQKLLVTGQALVHLNSILGFGEEIYFHWRKLQPKTQELEIRLQYPYLFRTPIGVQGKFELYKADSSWLSIDGEYGLQYLFNGNNYLQAGVRHRATYVQQVDTNYIKQNNRLPQVQDYSSVSFSLQTYWQQLNYFFNPLKGFEWRNHVSAGAVRIKKNNQIITLFNETSGQEYGSLYDTVKAQRLLIELSTQFSYYLPLHKKVTLKNGIEGGWYIRNSISRNEMFRIGGMGSLRGFDEQSIFTDRFLIFTEELRWLFSKNGYFYTFMQAGVIPHTGNMKIKTEFPFGVGVGATVDTKIGIFSLAYAIGKPMYEKFDFRKSKIHLGYINLF